MLQNVDDRCWWLLVLGAVLMGGWELLQPPCALATPQEDGETLPAGAVRLPMPDPPSLPAAQSAPLQRVPLQSVPERILPDGLECLKRRPGRRPVVLASGLFLSPHIFVEGPRGGLGTHLERRGFEVWLWDPWATGAGSIPDLLEAAGQVMAHVQAVNGERPAWIGLDFSVLLALQLPPERQPSALVAIGPRVSLRACPGVLTQALKEAAARQSTAPRALLTPLWTWGELDRELLDRVLLEDLSPLPPGISAPLAEACAQPAEPAGAEKDLPTPAFPVALVLSARDGLAPSERALGWYDRLPVESRALFMRRALPAPGHLGLLLGRRALRDTYRPLTRWLKNPKPLGGSALPVMPPRSTQK